MFSARVNQVHAPDASTSGWWSSPCHVRHVASVGGYGFELRGLSPTAPGPFDLATADQERMIVRSQRRCFLVMQWKELLALTQWMPLGRFPSHLEQLSKYLFKIDACQYCLGMPHADKTLVVKPGGPFLSALLWSCGDGAALRSVDLQIEKDENLVSSPPVDLLPGCVGNTYHEILNCLKTIGCKGISEVAGYRIATDGLFVHRCITSEMAEYYFRGRETAKDEAPHAIMWRQLPVNNR